MQSTGVASSSAGEIHVTGRRVLATIIDGIVLGIISFVINIPTLILGGAGAEGASSAYSTVANLLFAIVAIAYFVVMEGRLGQTVGKMVVGVEVVREGRTVAPGYGAAALRTLLRIVDGLFAYLVAFIVVLVSDKRQRLGDMAAGTQVVRK